MVNLNGHILDDKTVLSIDNRGFRYGDALFETIKVVNGKILFWETHYFRLMASMRIIRMEIPMTFTMEFLEGQIIKTLESNNLVNAAAKVRLYVYRNEGGLYAPTDNNVAYFITADQLAHEGFTFDESHYEVDLFKDYYVAPGLLSTLKTNNKILNVVGSVYAQENGLDNCLVLNTNKQVVEALNGNVFVLKDNQLKTPPLSDGCLKGVMRQQIIEIAKKIQDITVVEDSISPFELQKVDELFITNTIIGIRPVTTYRKKSYETNLSRRLIEALNDAIQ